MKTNFYVFFFTSFIAFSSFGQDYLGFRNGNYIGVNGAFYNPASIVDTRYRFHLNLASGSGNLGNSSGTFDIKNISESYNTDGIANKMFGEGKGTSSGFSSLDLHGPSLMFNTGKRMSFALTTRTRQIANTMDTEGKIINKINEVFTADSSLPYTISSSTNMRANINTWTEYGLSIARIVYDKENHFIKAGISLKYLSGGGNGYLNITNFSGTLAQDLSLRDNYLSNASGNIAIGFTGAGYSESELTDRFLGADGGSTGFSGDIGLVYEFRPEFEENRSMNKYKLKVGISLLDMGKIKYNRDPQRSGNYTIDIKGSERLFLHQLDSVNIDRYNAFFSRQPAYFTPASSDGATDFDVSLPKTLHLDIDYHLHKGFYVSLASQFSLLNNSEVYNSKYFGGFALTPRYEGKGFGFYLPLNYNSLTKLNAGATLRFGPFFIGSGSVISVLTGGSKQIDVHAGFGFGTFHK